MAHSSDEEYMGLLTPEEKEVCFLFFPFFPSYYIIVTTTFPFMFIIIGDLKLLQVLAQFKTHSITEGLTDRKLMTFLFARKLIVERAVALLTSNKVCVLLISKMNNHTQLMTYVNIKNRSSEENMG